MTVEESDTPIEGTESGPIALSSLGIDQRLIRVLSKKGIATATPVQAQAIPLVFLGKDVLAQARTGSGKTLAYLLPVLHHLIADAPEDGAQGIAGIRALVLVPTTELARQVAATAYDLLAYCPRSLSAVVNLCAEDSAQMQRTLLAGGPPLVVSTPSRLLAHLDGAAAGGPTLAGLRFLVVDEADLVLSFGHREDIERIARTHVPRTVQTLLMSATLTPDVSALRELVLRNPATVHLADGAGEAPSAGLSQYCLRCPADDRFLLMYVALKLRLLRGKLLVFAGGVDACMRLKLFLDQFGVRSCVLNAELPLASRHHIVDEYNRGVYDILLATDSGLHTRAGARRTVAPAKSAEAGAMDDKEPKGEKHAAGDEFGVARGVDFRRVDVVVNFDMPQSVDAYVHRVGRTARGGRSGAALSLLAGPDDERLWRAILADQETRGATPAPSDHPFDMAQLEGFRYRCADALRRVTPAAVRKARLRTVRDELLRSERLKAFFAERPRDLALLRHDAVASGVIRAPAHLRNVPSYLLRGDAQDPAHEEAPEDTSAARHAARLLPARISAAVVANATTDAAPRKRNAVRPRGGSVLRNLKRRVV